MSLLPRTAREGGRERRGWTSSGIFSEYCEKRKSVANSKKGNRLQYLAVKGEENDSFRGKRGKDIWRYPPFSFLGEVSLEEATSDFPFFPS